MNKTDLEKYFLLKRQNISEINFWFKNNALRNNKTIYCGIKCKYCCNSYLIGSNMEIELIFYFLNNNNFLMDNFTLNLKKWKKKNAAAEKIIRDINELIPVVAGQQTNGKFLSEIEYEKTLLKYYELTNLYCSKNIMCPFLYKNECSIYQIRPYVCVNLVSYTKPEFCASNTGLREICRSKIPPVIIPVDGSVKFVPIISACVEKQEQLSK